MNSIDLKSNDIHRDERHPGDAERPPCDASASDGEPALIRVESTDRYYRRATIAIILGMWLVQFVATSVLVIAEGSPDPPIGRYVPRVLVTFGGIGLSFVMLWIQGRLRNFSLKERGIIAAIMGVITPLASVVINYIVFYVLFDFARLGLPSPMDLAQDYLMRLWMFGSLSAVILALSYASDIREREQRIHALQQLAHSAQLRALRNQLNPHFLFNALNSIAGLMRVKRPADAETMTENLADFLRTTLALDPQSMITLDEELRLQNLYLAIEKVRFPDRLRVEVTIPAALEGALVPSLVTQPLIENSIKYAVARSTEPVHLRIGAERSGDQLVLTIEDDGGNATSVAEKSSRLGLGNIAERLRVHFGGRASITAEPLPGSGFRNRITLPLAVR